MSNQEISKKGSIIELAKRDEYLLENYYCVNEQEMLIIREDKLRLTLLLNVNAQILQVVEMFSLQ